MSTSRKALKIICIVMLVIAILGLVLGAFLLAGFAIPVGGTVDIEGQTMSSGLALGTMGIAFILVSVLDLVVACLGIRGCNTPSKIKPFLIFCYISLACMAISLIMSLVNGTAPTASGLNLVITVIETVLGTNVKNEALR